MIAEIAGLFGSRLVPRRGRTSVRRRRPAGRGIAIELLEPRQLLAITVPIVDNSGLLPAEGTFYVTGHGIPGSVLLPNGISPQQKWASPNPELSILDPSPSGSGSFTQAAVTIDEISVVGTTAKIMTTVPHQLKIGNSVFVVGTVGTPGSQALIDSRFQGVTGAFTVTSVHAGTTWSVSGTNPLTGATADAGWFTYTVKSQTGNPQPLTLNGSAAAYLPATISTPTVKDVSAIAGIVTVTLSEPANLPVNSPIFITGLTVPDLSVVVPSPPTPTFFTNVSLTSAGAVVTVTVNGPHGLVPGQAISVRSSDPQYSFDGVVNQTGLFDSSLKSTQFTYSVDGAPTHSSATGTITPTYSGAIAVNSVQFVANLSGPAPSSGSVTLSNNTLTEFNGNWNVIETPANSGLPETAVVLVAGSGPGPFNKGQTGDDGSITTGNNVDLNGLQKVTQNVYGPGSLTSSQFQYALTNASGNGINVTNVKLSVVSVRPVAVADLPKNAASQPFVTLDENIVNFSAQLVPMVKTGRDKPFSLGITPGEAAISNLETPPFSINAQVGNSVADIVEFVYTGQDATKGLSTFDLSGVDGFVLPLTLSSPDVKQGFVKTVGLNENLGTTREAVGTAFNAFVGKQPDFIKTVTFGPLLYDGLSVPPVFQPSVPGNQFYAIAAPKDWLGDQNTNANKDPMASYWDATLDRFFKVGNYVNIVTGNSEQNPVVKLGIKGVDAGVVINTIKFTAVNGTATALAVNVGDIVSVSAGTDNSAFQAAYGTVAQVLAADNLSFTIAGTYQNSVKPQTWGSCVANKMTATSYTGVSDGAKYTFTLDGGTSQFFLQRPSPGLDSALWVWAQAGIPADVTGTVQDQILGALCRGVANDGVFTSSSPGAGASNAKWTDTSKWYVSQDPTNVYCPYSKFLHFGTLTGDTDFTGETSIYKGGLAYAFAMDETPITDVGEAMANPLGGPSKMDGTVPDGATLSLTVNPWVQAAPIVTGLNKTQGSVNGGTDVTISGAGFNATSTVMLGSVPATNVRYQPASGGQAAVLIIASPAQTAGPVDIIVTTGQSTSASAAAPKFIYVSTAQPIVHPGYSFIAADAGTLTILGEHFSSTRAGNAVTLSSGTAIVQSVTATSITLLFTSRPTAGLLTATVKVGGVSSGAVQVAAVYATVTPAMASLAATAKTLVIMGTGFDTKTPANNVVTLSSGAGVVTKATATALTISLTTAPQIGPLSVTALRVRGVETLGLPVEVATVVPGPASAKSKMTTIAAQATVGDPVAVTMQAIDALGNLVTTGGAKVRFAASAAGTFSKVTDNGDGTYTASFTTKRVGAQIYYATANGVKVTETATTVYFIAQFTHPIPGADWLVKRGGFVAAPFAVIATAATNNVAIYKGASARNVTVSSNVGNLDDGQFGGVVARYSSKTSYYQAGLMLEAGQYYAVIQAVGLTGVRTLAKQSVAGAGEGYVSFRVNGSSLSLTLNGSQVAEVTDTRLKSGRVGMSGGQAVRFANFNAG